MYNKNDLLAKDNMDDGAQNQKYLEDDLFNKVNPKTSNRDIGTIMIE